MARCRKGVADVKKKTKMKKENKKKYNVQHPVERISPLHRGGSPKSHI
jgi:hypothetical protein